MSEIRRRMRVVGEFTNGTSELMLVAARLRHIAARSEEPASTKTLAS